MTTLHALLEGGLPLNRKERFFTGTVLPALVCADAMAHLHRLTEHLGVEDLDIRAAPEDCTVQFFTEYSLVESIVGPAKDRFPTVLGLPKDTPDVVVLVTQPKPTLVALEAKMFDRPSLGSMKQQLVRQSTLLSGLAGDLAGSLEAGEVRVVHAALLPQALSKRYGGKLTIPVVTWEWLRDAYADVDQPYFHGLLAYALANYDALVSPVGGYEDGELAGAKLVMRAMSGDLTWPYMGVSGGLGGKAMNSLIESGRWATRAFQVRHQPLSHPNPNWFTVTDFIGVLTASGVDLSALGPTKDDDLNAPAAHD